VGIAELFNPVITVDDVAHGKPAPDAYLLAAQRLGVDPAQCVAYEDSGSGMTSAREAGVGVIIDVRLHDPKHC
jgi:HAD superfamily hydrolase (TIGR01509 family)